MSKVSWQGAPLTSPVPAALVTCGKGEDTNIITIAWTGTVCSNPPMTYVSVMPKRFSHHLIKENMEFCINFAPAELYKQVDYCGIFTGAKVNKFEKCGLHKAPASKIETPIIEECPIVLECKVTQIISLGSHDMFIAEIVGADIDETLIDKSGKLHVEKADLVAYSHGDYIKLGKKLGSFGCSSVKKHKKKPIVKQNEKKG